MLEVIMKVTDLPKEKKDREQPQEKSMQPRSLHSQFPQCSNSVYGHIPSSPPRSIWAIYTCQEQPQS